MIQAFNHHLTRVFDIILYPFGLIGSWAQILIVSVVSSFIILFFFKKLSSAEKKKKAKDRIRANIFAIRIYKDFWRVILQSFFKSIYYTGKYFILNFAPVLVFLPILFLLSVQLDVRFGMRPFQPGEQFILTAQLNRPPQEIEIQQLTSKQAAPLIPPVYIDSIDDRGREVREVNWKMEAREEGPGELVFQIEGDRLTKSIVVGPDEGRPLSNRRFSSAGLSGFPRLLISFIHPVEPLMASGNAVEEISLRYPPDTVRFLFLNTHWLVYYILFIFIVVLSLKNRFGVEF